jgi:hypothetical protein
MPFPAAELIMATQRLLLLRPVSTPEPDVPVGSIAFKTEN